MLTLRVEHGTHQRVTSEQGRESDWRRVKSNHFSENMLKLRVEHGTPRGRNV